MGRYRGGVHEVPIGVFADQVWVAGQLGAAARRFRCSDARVVGVLWWYSASLVLLGPVVDGDDAGSVVVSLAPDGRLVDARSGRPGAAGAAGPVLAGAIDAVTAAGSAPRRALWAVATDSLATRVLWAGGDADVAMALASAISPELPRPRFVDVGGRIAVRRASCCLVYETPGNAKCVSCPRQPPGERLRRLRVALG